MDPLQQLWDLVESQMNPSAPMMGTPQDVEKQHPIVQQRRKIDIARNMGNDVGTAYQSVNGKLDLSDTEGKRDLASNYGRVDTNSKRNTIKYELDGPITSVASLDKRIDDESEPTSDDLRTKSGKEVANEVDVLEDIDYNWDVAYLQKYGRA